MLKYEEKLHMDKMYENMQTNTFGRTIGCLIWCLICYVAVYYGLLLLKGSIPDVFAWNHSAYITTIYGRTLYLTDLIYFIIGLVVMCYGSFRLVGISRVNHKARKDGSEQPKHLITTGYYEKVRHPMYGTFVIMYSAIAFSTHSLVGLMIVGLLVAGQLFNAKQEEKRVLIPLFQQEYTDYKTRVSGWILEKWQIVVLILFSAVTLAGLFPIR